MMVPIYIFFHDCKLKNIEQCVKVVIQKVTGWTEHNFILILAIY